MTNKIMGNGFDNFKTTFSDLLGGSEELKHSDSENIHESAEDEEFCEYDGANKLYESAVISKKTEQKKGAYDKLKSTTVISSDVEIHGDIKTGGNIEMSGTIIGNVTAGGRAFVAGTLTGDIHAESIEISGGNVSAKIIKAENGVIIGRNAVVTSVIEGNSVEADGKIEGNITVKECCMLKGRAEFSGDIECGLISIESGAVVNGKITVVKKHKQGADFRI